MNADVRLADEARPPLPAGDYRLGTAQTVQLPPQFQPPPVYRSDQRIRVAGPHLGLAPGDVVAVFPPAHADGDFSTALCHALLDRSSLPWEIDPEARPGGLPWLAVLLLAADEVDAGNDDVTGVRGVPLADYLRPPDGVLGPSLPDRQRDRWLAEQPDRDCTVVDVLAPAFAAVAPCAGELPWLAHVRDGHAVVLGNRLAARGRYTAHLVSLEGFVERLADRAGVPEDCRAVRLLSLARWAFTSTPTGAYFADLVEGLDIGPLRLPAPDPAAPAPVGKAVHGGYVPVDYRTRLGERTVAWYRGPLLPVPMAAVAPRAYPTAEAAMIYDEETGMFDLSFAVAWQAGRLLALADRGFTAALLAWVRAAEAGRRRRPPLDVGRLAGVLADALTTALPPPGDPTGLRRHRLPGVLTEAAVAAGLRAGADPAAILRTVR
ncbi:hypothetical protein ACFPIJ_09715 [Dactylosporangium cerinum]|uniref:Uncharacterized protein n=1 Tax=Dactylosporangium cerinum TaxID=1434730 RepID=A0ABV9VNZ9_9ACTN